MARVNATVNGKVTYREGDGVLMKIPPGPCEIEIEALDVTLSWFDDDMPASTAIPRDDFDRYVADGALVLEP